MNSLMLEMRREKLHSPPPPIEIVTLTKPSWNSLTDTRSSIGTTKRGEEFEPFKPGR